MKKIIPILLLMVCPFCSYIYSQNTSNTILFPPTPNPADDRCLIRMYLPDPDERAELRILDKNDSLLRTIGLEHIKGVQSTVVMLSDLPKGTLTCQLFYRGIISQNITIDHAGTESTTAHKVDSSNLFTRLTFLESKIKTYDLNMNYLRNYNYYQDSLITVEHRIQSTDSITNRIIELNREVIHLRLKLESFEQLVRELAILKVRNKLSENPMKKGNKYTLTRIYFESNNSDFLEKSKLELDDLVGVLNEFPSIVIQIKGHTDNVGNYGANLSLSKERAKNVYSYLVSKGIDANRLSYDGYGSNQPFTENITEEDRAINRRVEFVIMKE